MHPIVGNCELPDCAFIDCDSPGYPLQVYFNLTPEAYIANPDFNVNLSTWQTAVAPNVNVLAKDWSMGNIIDRIWASTIDAGTASGLPCDFSSDLDTCRLLYWVVPGQKDVSLTITDANGCQVTHSTSVQVVVPNCTMPAPTAQTIPTRSTCNPLQSSCPIDANGRIILTPPNIGLDYSCFHYYAEYSADDPDVAIPDDLYGNSAFVVESNGTITLNCLLKGFYRIRITDEISTCTSEGIFEIMSGNTTPLLLTNYIQSNPSSGCTGSFALNKINNADFIISDYSYAWSDCSTCNTPVRTNLCYGTHTLTVSDNYTGCSQTLPITIAPTCGGGGSGGAGTGTVAGTGQVGIGGVSDIDVYPTVFGSTANIKLILNYDAKVTVDVYDLYGSPIKKLIDAETKEAGEYYLQDDTNNAANGVYLYVVRACNEIKADIGIKE